MIAMASQMKAVPNVHQERKRLAKANAEWGSKCAMNHRSGFPVMRQQIAHAPREKPNLKNAGIADIKNHPVRWMAPGSLQEFAREKESASRVKKKK